MNPLHSVVRRSSKERDGRRTAAPRRHVGSSTQASAPAATAWRRRRTLRPVKRVERSGPGKPRDVVITAGRSRLLSHPLDTLRSQLNASILASTSPVSRDTAYRVFRGDPDHLDVTDAIVAAVSEAADDPAWSPDAFPDVIAAYQTSCRQAGDRDADAARAAVLAALRANFESQFRAPGLPVTWLLVAAALTSSPAWRGERPPDEDVALGREILEHRRRSRHEVTKQYEVLLTMVMSEVGRRPRRGVEPETIVELLYALHDGAVMRNLIEPGAVPSELVAEAMYGLAEALTEEGPHTEPRRPDDERGARLFDALVSAADELWRERPEVMVEEAADRAGVPHEAACLLFPTVGDLADSVIRVRVVGGGFSDVGPWPDDLDVSQRLVALVTELRNLRDFADQCPHAVTVATTRPPTRSAPFVEDFVDNKSRVVAVLGVSPDPVRLVTDMVRFAAQGQDGWAAVIALLRTIGYQDA